MKRIFKSVAIATMLVGVGCGANSDLVQKNEDQRNQIAQQQKTLRDQEIEKRKLMADILKLPVKEPTAVTKTEEAPAPKPVAKAAAPAPAPVVTPAPVAKAAAPAPVAAPVAEAPAPAPAPQAAPPPAPAPAPMAQTPAPVRLPSTVPFIVPGPNDPGRLPLIGYSDQEMDPCNMNTVQRSLRAYAMPMGVPMSMYPSSRKLPGRCAQLRRSQYAMHVRIGSQEMVARYWGGIPVSYASVKGADQRARPLVEPGNTVFWVMPPGQHTVVIDLYEPSVVDDHWEFVKTVCWTHTWPVESSEIANPWGRKQDTPENLPECKL